ncbi:MAG TPA: ABC transporter ATP-binding protein [Candidatus Saccharimonadales bacterium]|nr:ABC transporter ATP-binding protein [Candidatus Saccharimonadales bacterium]
MLALADVHTYYRSSYVLKGVTFAVPDGEVIALLGRNGMGKTTTVRSIMGLTAPRVGSITLDDTELVGKAPYAIARLGLGLVPQGRRVFGSLTVAQNLAVVADRRRIHESKAREDRVYALFPELQRLHARRAIYLSGGEQQMLAIGRALMTQPRVLLMDEPTEGLAPVVVNRLGAAIGELAAEGIAVLLVEQNMAFALRVAKTVNVLTSGEIVYHGPVEDFAKRADVQQRHIGVG